MNDVYGFCGRNMYHELKIRYVSTTFTSKTLNGLNQLGNEKHFLLVSSDSCENGDEIIFPKKKKKIKEILDNLCHYQLGITLNNLLVIMSVNILSLLLKIPVAARSKARVCGLSLAGSAGLNPTGVWISVSCNCWVLSSRGLCDGPIPRPEKPY